MASNSVAISSWSEALSAVPLNYGLQFWISASSAGSGREGAFVVAGIDFRIVYMTSA